MKTFLQFLDEEEKRVKLYGLQPPVKGMRPVSVGPAKPAKPFNGIGVAQIYPVPRNGKRTSGVMGSH